MTNNNRNGQSNREPKAGSTTPIIVTIGASAGGVAALQRFFEALPEHTGAVFVVVVHLDPDHRSGLPQMIGGRTRMPVIQVNRTEKLEADHVYVIPPDPPRSADRPRDLSHGIRGTARKTGANRRFFALRYRTRG
jgi:chemotaxis response regulator CheB